MANNLLTIGMITRESLRILENMLPFTRNVNTQYDDYFAKSGAKIGDSLNIRKPPRYVGRTGPLLQVESSVESTTPLTLNQVGCDISFSTKDMTLSIDDFSSRFIQPAIATVANRIDLEGMQLYKQVWNIVGTPGSQPTDVTLSNANALLDENATPFDGLRSIVLAPRASASLQQATKGLFQASSTIAEQYREGRFAQGLGFNAFTGQNVATHTAGPQGGTPVVNGAQGNTSSLVTNGWTAAAALRLRAGDTFTIANVFAVNPQSRQSTGVLQSFVVLSDVSSDGAGNATIPIAPAIVISGQNQTVDSAPQGGAAITVTSGTSNQVTKQSLAFHRDAFTFATADMELPRGVHMADRVTSKRSGISMRAVQAYDINTDQMPLRLDVLYGWAATRPEFAVRVEG